LGAFCTGADSGCEVDPDSQYRLRVYNNDGGTFAACTASYICSIITIVR
jgi:hypothetical protein